MFRKVKEFRGYMRNRDEVTAELVPMEAVVVDAPMPGLSEAMEAALTGDHEPVADLLASTMRRSAWDDRSHVIDLVARLSLRAPQWLDEWERDADPEDPAPCLVRSAVGISQAWEHRSHEQATNVTGEQFEAFHTTLGDTTDSLQRAVDLASGDPEPWRLALIHARGLEAPPEVGRSYMENLRDIDPWHHGGLRAAMEIQTQKWGASHEQMYDFAFGVASEAPGDARARTLPLDAVFEHLVADGADVVRGSGRTEEAIDLATAWLQGTDQDAYHVVSVHRNVLAAVYMLVQQYEDAFQQFVALGPHATRYPWAYWADDPRESFARYRNAVAVKAASRR